MMLEKENPGALAGARRVEVSPLLSKNDQEEDTPDVLDLQVRHVLARYVVSLPLAMVIAETAYSSGRHP